MSEDLEMLLKTLSEADDCKSLLKKHLNREKYDNLKEKETSFGGTLVDCIRSGAENLDSNVGLYASDPEAYTTFADVFDPIIKDYHNILENEPIKQPPCDFGNMETLPFEDLDPDGKYIISSRVRVARTHDGYGFPPTLTKKQREEIEKKMCEAFDKLPDSLKGTYYPISDMTKETQDQLIQDHYLFSGQNRFRKAIGGHNDWPNGRGIYFNEEKTFLVWVNEGDHMRLISMQNGGDIRAVYKRLITAIMTLEKSLMFAHDNRLGNVTFCPTNLGTSLRASVHIKIPHVSTQASFKDICDKYNLEARGIHGEHTESEGGVYDISNRRRLGLTEVSAVHEMYHGVSAIIKMEKELSWTPKNLDYMLDHISDAGNCKSLMKKYLTKDVVGRLRDKKTSHGATLDDCIRSGVMNLDSGIGIYAADPESYIIFADILDPVIKEYHKLKPNDSLSHPAIDFGDLDNLGFTDLDSDGQFVISTRIRVGRSHKEFAFPPVLSKEDRVQMEKITIAMLSDLDGELKGTYYPLTGMSKDTQDQLTADHFLFNDHDRFLKAAGGYKDWPMGRGIFFNKNKTFLVWVNEEDHLRIISMQKGGDIAAIYKRLVTAIRKMEKKLTFAHDDRLGFLTFCPSNLGTALRASVHIRIPHLSSKKEFKSICDKLKLQARGIDGEHTESDRGVFDISNKRRLGLSEIEAMKEMVTGIQEIIRMENDLQSPSE